MAPKTKKTNFTLDEQVRFGYYLLKIYNIGKACDNFSSKDNVVEYVEALQQRIAKADQDNATDTDITNAIIADDRLNSLGLTGDKSTSEKKEIRNAINQKAMQFKVSKINEVLDRIDDDERSRFEEFTAQYGIKDVTKAVIENRSYPNTDKIRNDLWLNYTELHASLPNHVVVTHDGFDIENNIGKFVAVRTYKTAHDTKKNDDVRDNFNNHPESKKKFLKLMGNLLAVGSPHLFRSGNIEGTRFDEIRKLSGASDMPDEQIKDLAKNIYDTTVDGLWAHKEKVNKDKASNKNDYVNRNVKDWISDLLEGKNNIRALAFLNPDEFEKYEKASEAIKEEIEKKHISIHHKIAIKYNGVISDGIEYNKRSKAIHPFNRLPNLMLIIGGELHKKEHNKDKSGMIDFSSVRDSRILLAPTKDGKSAKAVSMTMPEDKEMKQLRPQEANKKTFIQLRKSRGAR